MCYASRSRFSLYPQARRLSSVGRSSMADPTDEGLPLPSLETPAVFPFPYAKPYDIQLQLMQTVFTAIEQGKIGIVESPTGTGKSLSLLTATLTWLAAHQARLSEHAEASLREKMEKDSADEPAWVVTHSINARIKDLRAAQDALQERLDAARTREKERAKRRTGVFGRAEKRAKASSSEETVEEFADEKAFLPEDAAPERDDESNISPEVRALMAKLDAGKPKAAEEEIEEEDTPKIYYTSRTHTQLRQLTSELLKTSFPNAEVTEAGESSSTGTRMVPLGGRKQLCINEKVRAIGRRAGDERMNEACIDLQKSDTKGRCEYLPSKEDESIMLEARDTVLATVRDIEDVVTVGKEMGVCPYYATRKAVKQAQLVSLPYNLLLQKHARETLGISLKGQVIVIDEAHNLIDTLLSIHSISFPLQQIKTALDQLETYLARFRSRLKPVHALWVGQAVSLLRGIVKVTTTWAEESTTKHREEMLDVNELMRRVGGSGDQINLVALVAYLKESKLARKVSGYAERQAERVRAKEVTAKASKTTTPLTAPSTIAAFHRVESFLLSLADASDDGRVLLSLAAGGPKTTPEDIASKVTVKYLLLNPAQHFREVVDEARSVILAGGTMEPISDFLSQLFPTIPRNRFSTLSCPHVIPKENLLTQVVHRGPRKVDFEFKFDKRGDDSMLTELGAVVLSMTGLVPDGIVVFLPSYAFCEKVKAFWTASGLLEKLGGKKQVFYEPQTGGEVEDVLRSYSLAVSTPSNGQRKSGALLFAVVGAKLSEGINFSDGLGRCVIMVGLPFASVGSVELRERMRYVETLPGAASNAGRELYENICMRAVNQSIGRAIRHANDYACILLLDKRYSSERIRTKLPKWIGQDVRSQEQYSDAAKAVAAFFRDKRLQSS